MKPINEVMANLIQLRSVYEVRKEDNDILLIVTNIPLNDTTCNDILKELDGYKWQLWTKKNADFYHTFQTFITVKCDDLRDKADRNESYLFLEDK